MLACSEEESPRDVSFFQTESQSPRAQTQFLSAAMPTATTAHKGRGLSSSSELSAETNMHGSDTESPGRIHPDVSPQLRELVGARTRRHADLRAESQQLWEETQRHTQVACNALECNVKATLDTTLEREKLIEAELKRVTARTSQLRGQMTAWAALFTKLNAELKAMGDVSNWAQGIETDLAETLQNLDEFSERKRRAQGIQ